MNNKEAYNNWASTYDTAENKTRDIEAAALRNIFANSEFNNILEIGCGTGKNTIWLIEKAKKMTCVDFSEEMLQKASDKIKSDKVTFNKFDIRKDWEFADNSFDLVVCSLVLEHIEDLDFVFGQANKKLSSGGLFYLGELHPYKQYSGSKARFDSAGKEIVLDCYLHNISDFYKAAKNNNFNCMELNEWFDEKEKNVIPRLLTLVFTKI